MAILKRLRDWLLGPKPLSASDRLGMSPGGALRLDELPPFTLHTADLMRYDPQVRIGLGARNGLLLGGEVEVTGGGEEVARWVTGQWQRIWTTAGGQLARAKLYGFVPLEVMYRQMEEGEFAGAIEVDRLIDRHPRQVRLLVRDGAPAGFSQRQGAGGSPLSLLAPKALVCTFDAEFGNPYGCSILQRAYPAWHEKWMAGGAKKTLRLRMIKDAYVGDILWYPADRKVTLPSGETVSWRDVARELVESRSAGGALTLPLLYDRDGRKLVDYTPPQDVAGGTQIFQWKQDVDLEIWKALELPPEVIEAASTGSGYSGRAIPLLVALAAVQAELNELVQCVDRDVLRPLVHLNFGRAARYEIRPRPLAATYADLLR